MRVLILGLDAFDPAIFQRLAQQGRLPNLNRMADAGGFAPFGVANPPQSEVSWTSIATGQSPGGHGIFDFVHREPQSYQLFPSLLPTKTDRIGTHFVPPYTARTIFEEATRQGYPAKVLWWPATFPARPELPVHTLPGLGAPDLLGRLGVGTEFSTASTSLPEGRKTPLELLEQVGKDRLRGYLRGPARKKGQHVESAPLEVQVEVTGDRTARLVVGKQSLDLTVGQWSPIIEVEFKMGLLIKVHAITQVILTQVRPDVSLYFVPLQIHPLHSTWRYATPGSFARQAWNAAGSFLTLGWPQDTTGLEDGCISDQQFVDLCDDIDNSRERVLLDQLRGFKEGVLGCVFDTLDRVQHMFWRDNPQIIDDWYVKLDRLVGRVQEQLAAQGGKPAKVVIVSDHGFTRFDYKVHLNRWLQAHSYLTTQEPRDDGNLHSVAWSQTQAYAFGLNSLCLNLAGREGQGIVEPGHARPAVDALRQDLLAWRGPDGQPVVQAVRLGLEVFDGPLAAYGPDLVVGYAPGYRASAETGLGQWKAAAIEPNQDHWSGDHCIDADAVPGVLFCSDGLASFPNPTYRDFPRLTIGAMSQPTNTAPPPMASAGEDEKAVEERLKSLGYL